jgi:2-amino-4-hydroxy-6-hydroxymethyldihydropteridine diphosphokinase
MHHCYLLLGSNLGNRAQQLSEACNLVELFVGDIAQKSSVYETLPWGLTEQPNFYNQVIKVETSLNPQDLLMTLLQIEEKLGRERLQKWDARKIDLDILYFDQLIINHPELKIPHPEIANRRFTLVPLVEIASAYLHPILKKTNQELLKNCKDNLDVKKL